MHSPTMLAGKFFAGILTKAGTTLASTSLLVGVPVLAFSALGNGLPSPRAISEISTPSFDNPALTLAKNQAAGKKYTIPLGEATDPEQDQTGKRTVLPRGLSMILSAAQESQSGLASKVQGTPTDPRWGGEIPGISNPSVSNSKPSGNLAATQGTVEKAIAGNPGGSQTAVNGNQMV